MLVLSPLWFLVVYMALVVTVPLWDRLDRRWGELVPIGLAAAAMGIDLVRFRYGHPEVAWFNMILVWGRPTKWVGHGSGCADHHRVSAMRSY